MASIYQRPDTRNHSVCFYPRPGGKLIHASLGVADPLEAEKALRKVELLCELDGYCAGKFPDVTNAWCHGSL